MGTPVSVSTVAFQCLPSLAWTLMCSQPLGQSVVRSIWVPWDGSGNMPVLHLMTPHLMPHTTQSLSTAFIR
eukprot:7107175-Pyramimonas_sp.AAC.1